MVDFCAEEGILSSRSSRCAAAAGGRRDRRPPRRHAQQVKLAWLLRRSEAMLPIPGTLSIDHLRSNLAALDLELSDEDYEAYAA